MRQTLFPLVLGICACGGANSGGNQAAAPAPSHAAASPAPAGVTPELIREAIAIGNGQKPSESLHYNLLRRDGTPMGMMNTPFSRIADAARTAKGEYRPFTEAEVTRELSAPEITVFAVGSSPAIVRAVVVFPQGSTDPNLAIQPLRTERPPQYADSMIAHFPLSALSAANEVRVVYERSAPGLCTDPGPTEGAAACAAPFPANMR